MPATAVTVARPNISGVNSPTPVAADTVNGNSVPNLKNLVLTLNNSGGSPYTVTFVTPVTHAGYAVNDLTVTLAAGATKNFSNFPGSAFGSTLTFTAQNVAVMISAVAPAES
jgi:hypothetical protein